MESNKILFVCYEHQKIHFLSSHATVLFANHNIQSNFILLDEDFNASRSSPLDLTRLIFLVWQVVRNEKPIMVVSITPKAGFICAIISLFTKDIKFSHWFTGQVWCNDHGIKRFVKKIPDLFIGFTMHHIFCDSEPQRKFLLTQGFKYIQPKMIVPGFGSICGVDMENIPKLNFKKRSVLRVGIVGRINQDKGFKWLIDNFDLLARVDNVEYHIFGEIDDPYLAPFFEKWINSNNNVHYHGAIHEKNIIYSSFDVLACFSYREGFSNVLIEAQAFGIPVIVRRIYAVEETFKDGQTGMFWEDADDYCQKLEELRNNLGTELSSRCQKFVRHRFDQQRVVTKICRLYNTFTGQCGE